MPRLSENDVITQGNLFVSPSEFFCGDKVTVSFNFIVTEGISYELEKIDSLSFTTLEEISAITNIDENLVHIDSILLSAEKNNANITIECTFWKTGDIELPQITIPLNTETLEIHVPQIQVASILEKTGVSSLRQYKGPQIIPGSSYIVWASIVGFVVILALLIAALVNISRISKFFKKCKRNRILRKNYHLSISKLKILSKMNSKLSDQDFCQKIQSILRDYFSIRFDKEIYSLTTGEIVKWYNSYFRKLLPSFAENAIQLFYEIMTRCDFLRFSKNTQTELAMQKDERKSLIEKTEQVINLIEKGSWKQDADI